MWLKNLFKRKPKPLLLIHRSIDFTRPTKEHWATFQGGTNYDAMFLVRGNVAVGDEIRITMRSGRIGRYRVYSCRRDFMGYGDWTVQASAIGYAEDPPVPVKIKGLLGTGARWVRSDAGELAHLPSGFTKPASEFWKIYARNEASSARADSLCTKRNL